MKSEDVKGGKPAVTVMIADPLHYRLARLLLIPSETHGAADATRKSENVTLARTRDRRVILRRKGYASAAALVVYTFAGASR